MKATHEDMVKTFEEWSNATLLEELVERADDYLPEARDLLHGELHKRGISEAEIEQRTAQFHQQLEEVDLRHHDLAVAETFGDRLTADAAQNILREAGIESYIQGNDSLFFGPGLLRFGPNPITLKVAEANLGKAKEILDAFEPPEGE
jgi:hypothetical protein